jgi:alanine racemase
LVLSRFTIFLREFAQLDKTKDKFTGVCQWPKSSPLRETPRKASAHVLLIESALPALSDNAVMPRPLRADISLSALRHNYAAAKNKAPRSKAFAVVKANAYGHGVERVAKALSDADGFATLELESAVRLRERGIEQPILLLEGFFDAGELETFAELQLTTSIHAEDQIEILAAAQLERSIDVFVKMNSGMNRLGFAPADYRKAVERLAALSQVKSVTLMTHFSSSDEPGGIDEAMRRFKSATEGLNYPVSLSNSAATLACPEAHGAWVRPGIMLYGATPFADRGAAFIGLKPVMTLTSQIIAIQEMQAGEGIGYGLTFRSEAPLRVGIVACGYADGYPRIANSGTPIAVDGQVTRTVGRVSMDMLAVDLTNVRTARVGSKVELWGSVVPVDDVAKGAGTVGYEMLCAVAPRVPVFEAE